VAAARSNTEKASALYRENSPTFCLHPSLAAGSPSTITGDPTAPMAGRRLPWSTSTTSRPISRRRQ